MLYRAGLTLMLLMACVICLTQVTPRAAAEPVSSQASYPGASLAATGPPTTALVQ